MSYYDKHYFKWVHVFDIYVYDTGSTPVRGTSFFSKTSYHIGRKERVITDTKV